VNRGASVNATPVIIPHDVIFAHIAPFAIHSLHDALAWMLTCKSGLKAATLSTKFWEPFLVIFLSNLVETIRNDGMDRLATLIEQSYVFWPEQMMSLGKSVLQVVKSKLSINLFHCSASDSHVESLLNGDIELATVTYSARFSFIEEVNQMDSRFRLFLGAVEMQGQRSSLHRLWHRVGMCTIKCDGLEFHGEFCHSPQSARSS
jgi:hypothetical protein